MRKISMQEVTCREGMFSRVEKYSSADSPKVEWVEGTGKIPMLRFSWNETVNFFKLTEEEAKQANEAGLSLGEESDLHLVKNDRSFLCFMNFRRYAWSWTNEEEGKYGYARGPCYANGNPIVGMDTSMESILRDSFVVAVTQLRKELPQDFTDSNVDRLFTRLFWEAEEHLRISGSDHLHPKRDSGSFNVVEVVG